MILFVFALSVNILVNINFISAITYDCTVNSTLYLPMNNVSFFQTNNYPQLLSAEEFNSFCDINFALEENNYTNYRLFTVTLENGFDEFGDDIPLTFYPELSNSTIFKLTNIDSLDFYAANGFILFDEWDDGCLFESVSRRQPFQFTNDETEHIFLLSSFQMSFTQFFFRKNACKWQFSAPLGYGFKISVIYFNLALDTTFFIENSTDTFVNKRSANVHHVYYNNDNWIQISLSKGGGTNPTPGNAWIEFGAIVSIVKMKYTINEAKCPIKINADKTLTWTNIDQSYSGYKKNSRCTFNLLIFPNTEVFVEVMHLEIEEYVDLLGYYPEKNASIVLADPYNDMIFLPHYTGSIKQIVWEFSADGNLQSTGFELNFRYQECSCADHIIPCNGTSFTLMKGTDYYCSNLHCKYTISPCSGEDISYFQLDFYNHEIHGIFKIISNGITILNVYPSSNDLEKTFFAFLKSSNENIFEVITSPKAVDKKVTFKVEPIKALSVNLTIVLSLESPVYIADSSTFTIAVIKFSEDLLQQNLTIILYVADAPNNNFQLYSNKSLTVSIQNYNCFGKQQTCKLSESGAAIYVPSKPDLFTFIGMQVLKKNFGCIFQRNIYTDNNANNFSVAAMANEFDDCIIYVIFQNSVYYSISHLWTTSLKNVDVFVGINKTKHYLEYNSKSMKKWNELPLFSSVYTFVLPKKSTLFIQFKQFLNTGVFVFPLVPAIIKPSYPYSSLLATPYYGNSKMNIIDITLSDFLLYVVNEYPIKITAIDYFMLPGDECYFAVNDEKYFINKIGDSLIFVNQTVSFRYSYVNTRAVNNGALFFIETLENTFKQF